MSNLVNLTGKTSIVGLSNVVVSEVDDTVYINTQLQVSDGLKGSVLIYKEDGQTIGSDGSEFMYDTVNHTLSASNITVKNIEADCISTEDFKTPVARITEYCESLKTVITKWFGFASKKFQNEHPFKFKVSINPESDEETLVLVVNEYTFDKSKISLAFDRNRILVNNKLNISTSTVKSSVGSLGDKKGDIAIDENYIYFCVKDFDGVSKIWKRTELTEW